ncbi:hypothetical protein TNCV_3666721 [Trichonephila clavipes]|nr:hypothetical protein TNCV_3666721 [Trichonephila clavipes]
MYLNYGMAEGNSRAAESISQRDPWNNKMFANLRHNLCEYGTLKGPFWIADTESRMCGRNAHCDRSPGWRESY